MITFPAHYPNQAIPSFEFAPDTSIDTNTKTKLIEGRFVFILLKMDENYSATTITSATASTGNQLHCRTNH